MSVGEGPAPARLESTAAVDKRVWRGAEKRRRFRPGPRFSAGYRKCSMNVVRVASSDGLERRSSVIVSTEYMTVE